MASTLWPLPKVPYNDLNTNLNGLPDMIAKKVTTSPNYQKLAGEKKSYGAAGLLPALPAMLGAAPLAAAAGGALAAPAAAAYGIGKLIAPDWTDEAVKKIGNFVKEKVGPALGKAEEIGSAYETGMLSSVPGSRFIQKKLPQEVQETIEQIKNQHPLAAKAGQAAGTIGAMALPGANVVKGAGLLGTAANAAINAAPFALGTGLDVGAETGDVKKGLGAGALSMGLGTAVPTGLSALSKIPVVANFLAKLQLGSAGVRSNDINKITRGYAKSLGMSGGQIDTYAAKNADKLVNEAADLVGKYGATRGGRQAIKKWNSEGFDTHAKLWDELTGKKIAPDDIAAVLQDADLAPLRARFGDEEVAKTVAALGKEIDGQGWTASRRAMSDYQKAGNRFQGLAADDPRILKSSVADVWHDRLDSVADRIAEKTRQTGTDIPSLQILKATYPATLAMTKAEAREAAAISGRFAGGSDTAVRQALMAAPMIAGGGVVAPGAIGDMLQNPENIPQDLLKIGLGSVAGRLLTRGAGRGAELGTGALAGQLRKAGEVPSAALGRLLGQSGELVAPPEQAGGPTGETLGGQPQESPDVQGTVDMVPIPNALAQPPSEGVPPGAVPIPNAQPSPQEQAQVQFRQAGQPAPQEKIGKWNDAFVNSRIEEKYSRYVRQYGNAVSFDDYKTAALRSTQGLDPTLPNTWKAMFDDPATGEKLYNGYMNLQKVEDVDPGAALNHYTRFFQPGPRLAGPAQKKEMQDNSKLVQALSDMTKQSVKTIDDRLKQIAWDKGKTPEQKKQAVMDMIIKEGGIDVPLLVKTGLWGG